MNTFTLPDGQYLSTYLNFLPANVIIYKTLTGCGATYLELACPRHSILIEPYIPVIKGKASNKIFPVHGDVKVHNVVDYFNRTDIEHYKLVSTPEGHKTIQDAAELVGINLYNDFFLLIDECEKLIQDVNFRPNIISVMEAFFQYKNRSFISATPIPPTDPRFKQFNFENYYIVPEKHRDIQVNLRITNSIATTVKDYFVKNRADNYIIFINSTERIASIIKFLKIERESQVFCSAKSADHLRIGKIPYAQEDFEVNKMKKYNFFTSRFFTAFDMILDYQPNILIVSDVKKVEHSALDPATDVIQIIGRARNGHGSVTHISNCKEELRSLTETGVRDYLDGAQEAYLTIKSLRDSTNRIGAYDVLNEALKLLTFKDYLNVDDTINHFMIDQEVHINRVRGYYQTPDNLVNAYSQTNRFITCTTFEEYDLKDDTIDKLQNGLSRRDSIIVICESLHRNFTEPEKVFSLTPNHMLYYLIQTHQDIYQYYRVLGIEKIRELEYNPKLIEKAYNTQQMVNSGNYFGLFADLKLIFKRINRTTGQKINKILSYFFRKHNIKTLKPTVTQLDKWFHIYRTTDHYDENGKEVKVYVVGKPKF